MKKNQESLQSLEQVGTISKKESSKLVRKYQKRLSKAIKERNLEQIIRTTVEAENNFGLDNDNLDKLYAIATPTYEWIIQDISEKIKEGSNVTKQQKFEFLLIRARYYFRLKRFSEQVADLVSARGIAPKARQNELDEKLHYSKNIEHTMQYLMLCFEIKNNQETIYTTFHHGIPGYHLYRQIRER